MSQSRLVGQTIRHRYKLFELLAGGLFSDTYLALDLDMMQRQCVVKHLKLKYPNSAVVPIAQRLLGRQAEILYQLGKASNQIPELYAYFEEHDDFYLVEEFIDGHDLSFELIPGVPKLEIVVKQLLQDILEILTVVHQHNIIHRDLKPQNVMRRSQDGSLFLIDFGVLKQIGILEVNNQEQTIPTVVIGTPGYMPIEQAYGMPMLCSDVYAVGMIGIQALTGIVPHQLPKDPDTEEVLWRNQAQVSDRLADVLDTMVRSDFRQRYNSAAEALQALTSIAPP